MINLMRNVKNCSPLEGEPAGMARRRGVFLALAVTTLGLSLVGLAHAQTPPTTQTTPPLPKQIDIITDSKNPVQYLKTGAFKINYYEMDAAEKWQDKINRELTAMPGTDAQKQQVIKSWFATKPGGQLSKHMQEFQAAYLWMDLVSHYGLKSYPAIVFNKGEAVVYGMNNLQPALAKYQEWQSKH